MGTITVYYGPMFSGKTTRLLQLVLSREETLKRDKFKNSFVLGLNKNSYMVLKPQVDNRYEKLIQESSSPSQSRLPSSDVSYIASHDNPAQNKVRATNVTNETLSVNYVHQTLFGPDSKNPRYVYIDEGHFFDNIVEVARELRNQGSHVFIACIDVDYKGCAFENIEDLIKIADFSYNLRGKCGTMDCLNPSTRTYLKEFDTQESRLIVGGSDKYIPLCERCFNHLHYWDMDQSLDNVPPPSLEYMDIRPPPQTPAPALPQAPPQEPPSEPPSFWSSLKWW